MPPATQPTPRVEIFAFTPIAKPTDGDWVGRGIQENLQSDVSHTGATLVLPPQAMPGSDDAINSAKQNHADLAVIGTYQVLGDQIRVNGNIVDVATNASLGGFSATGLRSDLFKVEDALGEQLKRFIAATDDTRSIFRDSAAIATGTNRGLSSPGAKLLFLVTAGDHLWRWHAGAGVCCA